MSGTKFLRMPQACKRHQRGAAAVEFAHVVIIFFMFVFAVIEMARLMFIYNTLPEVTRRAASAAANTDFSKPAEMDKVRANAIFQTSTGTSLPLMSAITDAAIRIDYMAIERTAGTGAQKLVPIASSALPASPEENRRACLIDPYAANCIRVVRVRVCDPDDSGECKRIPFHSLIPLFGFTLPLPLSPTYTKAQSLGL